MRGMKNVRTVEALSPIRKNYSKHKNRQQKHENLK